LVYGILKLLERHLNDVMYRLGWLVGLWFSKFNIL